MIDRKRISPNRRSIIRRMVSTIVRAFSDLAAGLIEAAQLNRLAGQAKNVPGGDTHRIFKRVGAEIRRAKFKHIGCDYRRRRDFLQLSVNFGYHRTRRAA